MVELRIYEGDARNDITFSYNANFFLFTTLENARPIAQGRVPAAQNSFPVLTGMPVAGMAYLDRPSPAGYFIFPDLSVRHEGKYRLSFNLFEELKEPKDADVEPTASSPGSDAVKPQPNNAMAPQAHVHFRLEVKSVPFSVFSAKKFPGLAESTNLSRVVAEQGCRVRIRRDVRMRRRDTKAKAGYDEFEDEPAYARSDRFTTPDLYNKPQVPSDRPNSISNASIDPGTPFSADRRPSMQELSYYNQANGQQPPPPVPQPQPATASYVSHLSFGNTATPHFTAPVFQPPAAPVSQPPPGYMQNNNHHNSNNHNYQYPNVIHSRQRSGPPNGGYPQAQPAPQPAYAPTNQYPDNGDYRQVIDYRRPSVSANNQGYPAQNMNSYIQVDNRQPSQQGYYQPPVQASAPRALTPAANGHALPPLKTLQPPLEKKYEPNSPVTPMQGPSMAPVSAGYDGFQTKYSPYSATPHSTTRSTKRPFGTVFDTEHMNQPMHGGMRPSSSSHGQDVPQIEAEDGSLEDAYDLSSIKMLSYRRADGSRQAKKCPSPVSE